MDRIAIALIAGLISTAIASPISAVIQRLVAKIYFKKKVPFKAAAVWAFYGFILITILGLAYRITVYAVGFSEDNPNWYYIYTSSRLAIFVAFWVFSVFATSKKLKINDSTYKYFFGSLIYCVVAIHVYGFINTFVSVTAYLNK